MNTLFVTTYDLEGQQFNGYQIHKALLSQGHTSHMAVASYRSNEPEIKLIGTPFLRRLNGSMCNLEAMLSMYSILPVSALSLYFDPWYRNADIIHLQLLHALPFFSLLNLPIMSRRKKVLWTIHDPWITTGHCVHPLLCDKWLNGCDTCPELSRLFPITNDTSALMWRLKKWILHHSELTLIVASQWMYEHVQRSPILSHLPCHIIPFGLDTTIFKPKDKAKCRAQFGIPNDAHVLLFRNAPHYEVKGAAYVIKALELLKLSRATYIITLDNFGGLDELRGKYNFVELGWVDDQEKIASALNAADLLLMPSLAETFGMMSIESLACGTPLIVFEGTALPSVIRAPDGGFAVPSKDHAALTKAIETLLSDRELYNNKVSFGIKLVKENYTKDLYVNRHIELYETMLNNNQFRQ